MPLPWLSSCWLSATAVAPPAAPTVAMPRAAAATASVFLIDHEVRANGTAPADTGTAGTGDTVDPAGTAGVASDGTGTACHRFHPLHGLVDAGCRVERPLHRRGVGPGLGPRLGPGLRFRLGGRHAGDVLGLVSRCAGRSGFGHGVLLGRGKRSHDPEVRGRPCAATVHSPRAGHEATRRPGHGAQAMRPRATWAGIADPAHQP